MLPFFFMSVVLHEVSHGWVAERLGDTTARRMGRLSLNPLRHVDMMGTILLPFLLIVMRSPVIFGWAKPVPIDALSLRPPKRDLMWVGLAGPAMNLILALGFGLTLRVSGLGPGDLLWQIGAGVVLINLVLAFFNLIPIPPLDGSRILVGLLPIRYARLWLQLEPFGFLVLVALLFFGVIHRILGPLVAMTAALLGVRG